MQMDDKSRQNIAQAENLPYPEECGRDGQVTFRFFPKAIECELTFHRGDSYQSVTGRVTVPEEMAKLYYVAGRARQALAEARRLILQGAGK